MNVLVTYASRHGATRGIAERIAETLERAGLRVTIQTIEQVRSVADHDAVVIGSAAYMNHWLKDATAFVRRNRAFLADRPVWLFSSGPLGTDVVDEQGRDVLQVTEPREFVEFADAIHPRGERVFFGAYDPDAKPVGLAERLGAPFMKLPAVREAVPAGDFRDWEAIDAWAREIAADLTSVPAGGW